jgi:hypothetical protein
VSERWWWSLSPLPGVVLAWLVVLGWRAQKWQSTDGTSHGPYVAWQVVLFVVIAGVLVWFAAERGLPTVVVAATTVGTTGIFAADASGRHDSGLWVVGAVLVLLGSLVVSSIIALVALQLAAGRARVVEKPRVGTATPDASRG